MAQTSSARRAPVEIPVRRLDLGLDVASVPRDYYGDDVHLTTMLNALSVLFPEGERFFVDSVRHFKGAIDDPRLQAEIMAFVGQEAMHSREHALLTDILEAQGLTTARVVDERLRDLLGFVRRALSPKNQLAATCALEHFTALLAERLLEDQRTRELFHESIRGLWCWHALEESEHKSVAFDVYEEVSGSYLRRVSIMVLTTVVFVAVTAVVYAAMLQERKSLFSVRGLARYVNHFWLRDGFFSSLIPAYLEYFKPGFHPTQRNTEALVASWSERLFGPGGALHAQLKQVRTMPVRTVAMA